MEGIGSPIPKKKRKAGGKEGAGGGGDPSPIITLTESQPQFAAHFDNPPADADASPLAATTSGAGLGELRGGGGTPAEERRRKRSLSESLAQSTADILFGGEGGGAPQQQMQPQQSGRPQQRPPQRQESNWSTMSVGAPTEGSSLPSDGGDAPSPGKKPSPKKLKLDRAALAASSFENETTEPLKPSASNVSLKPSPLDTPRESEGFATAGGGAIAKGTIVTVEARTWPGINKPGGVARVTKVHPAEGGQSARYDVAYVLGGKEKKVEGEYVSIQESEGGESDASTGEPRKRKASAEEDILMGRGSRHSSSASLRSKSSGGEGPDAKRMKADEGSGEEKKEEESCFEMHHRPAPWSARRNLGGRGKATTLSTSASTYDTDAQPRWRTHQMAEDYISLASAITLPPAHLGTFGYSPATGNYPIEQATALGYLTSPLRRPTVVEKWSPIEIATFEAALALHGKAFHQVQKWVKTKNTKEIVEFYYVWKKTSHGRRWKGSYVEEMESESESEEEGDGKADSSPARGR
ncbi:hypothetical protein ACHAXT_011795 [Thalassiosira profunda]